ncbi:MAG TPA: NAD(P)-dependent oxidoreductase [Gaiellaceae bacterium]|nr:NAD(P)-dependent oxidoreductase [Gaiellaceae bacterium]
MTDASPQLASGMIGLGNMGGRIARRIRDGGLPIRGFDVSEEQAKGAGVDREVSIATLAESVDVVFLSLPDSSVIESVVFDDGGLVSSLRSGQVVVDLSTAAPSSSARIHDRLGEVGAAFLDAGISGGAAAAEKGALTLMVGGDASALERVRPILQTFSTGVHHMGAPGSGHTAKVLNNFLNGVSLAATAEVMVAAKQAGLDLAQFLEVVNTSSGVNFATLNRFPRIVEGDYLEGGLTSRLMAKDLRLYLELLQEVAVTSFCGPACLGAFNLATALGYGDQISNRVVDAIGDVAGGVRIQQ